MHAGIPSASDHPAPAVAGERVSGANFAVSSLPRLCFRLGLGLGLHLRDERGQVSSVRVRGRRGAVRVAVVVAPFRRELDGQAVGDREYKEEVKFIELPQEQ